MDEHKAEELLRKYRDNTCTPEERELVETYFSWHVLHNERMPDAAAQAKAEQRMHKAVDAAIHKGRQKRLPTVYRVAIAATLLIALSVSLYLYRQVNHSDAQPALVENDVLPGGNRALLTLADGRTIDLDNAGDGLLAEQTGITISKTADGLLTYEISESPNGSETVAYNTITTPNGGQYQIILPDKSKVWLNAASSLHYPTSFSGNERRVTLTGEGYFEITHNPDLPFIVESNGQSVQVLGTSFNINAYEEEEAVVSTLVTGKIALQCNGCDQPIVLKPGDQSVNVRGDVRVRQVDTNLFSAWKEGLIVLDKADLPTVIRQIQRWYDVEFVGAEDINIKGTLSGEVPRAIKLSGVLQALERQTNARFEIKGRRIMVRY